MWFDVISGVTIRELYLIFYIKKDNNIVLSTYSTQIIKKTQKITDFGLIYYSIGMLSIRFPELFFEKIEMNDTFGCLPATGTNS